MSKHAPTEDVHISRAHVQIPEEVSQRLALEQTTHAIVSPNPLLPVAVAAPGLALFVKEDNVQAQAVDHAALHERNDVYIPADPSAFAELGVDVWEEAGRDDGRHHVRDEGVHREGEENLMGVQRKSREAEEVGDVLEGFLQRGGRLDGVRVEHDGGGSGEGERRPDVCAELWIGGRVLESSLQHGGQQDGITSGGQREQSRDERGQSRTRFGCVLLNHMPLGGGPRLMPSGSKPKLCVVCAVSEDSKNASCVDRSIFRGGMGIFASIHIKSVGMCSPKTHESPLLLVQVSYDILVQLSWGLVDLMSARVCYGVPVIAECQQSVRRTISQSGHLWWL
jgi:hypothetical protein